MCPVMRLNGFPPSEPGVELKDLMVNSGVERHESLRGDSDPTELVLVRHGRTKANAQGLFLGSTDVALDPVGMVQAECVADRIQREWSVDRIVSSPLQRARVTAEAIARRFSIPVESNADLREMDFGEFEGKTFEEIVGSDPDFVNRLADFHDEQLTWPGGESRGGFHRRVWEAFESVVRGNANSRVVVVAHGGVIGAFMAMLRGQPPGDPAIYTLKNCSITHLIVGTPHTEVHRFNCVLHLDGLDGWTANGQTEDIK